MEAQKTNQEAIVSEVLEKVVDDKWRLLYEARLRRQGALYKFVERADDALLVSAVAAALRPDSGLAVQEQPFMRAFMHRSLGNGLRAMMPEALEESPVGDKSPVVGPPATSSTSKDAECRLPAGAAFQQSFAMNTRLGGGVVKKNNGLLVSTWASRKNASCAFSIAPNSYTVKYCVNCWLVSKLSASRLRPKSKRCVGNTSRPGSSTSVRAISTKLAAS